MATSGRTGKPKSDQEAMRGALAALVFASLRPLDDTQREAFANDLASMGEAARSGGQPRTAELVDWLVRAAQFARKRLSLH